MTLIALLPLDDRPVNYNHPQYLARVAGVDISLPPQEFLGNPRCKGRHTELVNWLMEVSTKADALIIALDTLAYGGLIPSRTSDESFQTVLNHLTVLRDLKQLRPQIKILAFNVIMRISREDSSEEEKEYWATYGSQMFRLSCLEHKSILREASSNEVAERDTIREQIPDDVYNDYLHLRKRNNAINNAMLDWLEDGIFDYLIFPQDDTSEYGWNVAEARDLHAVLRSRGLIDFATTYPGTDEIGCLLLARYICQREGFAPRVWPRYNNVIAPTIVTAYEDRPIHELLKAHLNPLNGTIADSPEHTDIVLYINAPTEKQGIGMYQWLIHRGLGTIREQLPQEFHHWVSNLEVDEGFQITRAEINSPCRSIEEFKRALLRSLKSGYQVALADVAFVNGSDLLLGEILLQQPEITRLAGYGGWNTAGNTLGAVLAQAVIHVVTLHADKTERQLQAQFELLFIHLLDDFIYQARERTLCMVEDLPTLGLSPSNTSCLDSKHAAIIESCVRQRLTQALAEVRKPFIQSGIIREVQVTNIHLPWHRLFEVGFDVQVELN